MNSQKPKNKRKKKREGISLSLLRIVGETVETVTDFIFLGSKITADGDTAVQSKDNCSLEENL